MNPDVVEECKEEGKRQSKRGGLFIENHIEEQNLLPQILRKMK